MSFLKAYYTTAWVSLSPLFMHPLLQLMAPILLPINPAPPVTIIMGISLGVMRVRKNIYRVAGRDLSQNQ
jgi:hypothetical protein